MHKVEDLFDINIVLMTLFSSLETIRDQKNIELIYDMQATLPRELRGDSTALLGLLSKLLAFVLENTDKKEIILLLEAPEDFVFEEFISFKIQKTNIAKEKILEFLEKSLSKDLERLDGKIIYERNSDIHLDIPFMINELGFRRYYHLPDESMLDKKVLLICESEHLSQSIKEMFNYFNYDVEVGLDTFKSQGNDLTSYDILIIEDKFNTEELEEMIARVQQNIPLKYVLLKDSHHTRSKSITVSTNLIKPVTEESIYELIITLFQNSIRKPVTKSKSKSNIVDIEKFLHFNKKNMDDRRLIEEDLHAMIEKEKKHELLILDREMGEENTKKMSLKYSTELKNFLVTFEHSDIYFRDLVNEKITGRIKEFCIDLEKHAKLIGAQSMLKFIDTVNLIFIYNKLDMLPIYPGKYHIELQKLIEEIKKELHM